MKSLETEGKTVDQAIEIGLYKLGVTRDQVKINILEQAGLFNKAKVRLTLEQSSEAETAVKDLAEKLTKLMNLSVDVYVEEKEDHFYIDITGDDASYFIGKHGENLDSFQFIINSIFNKGKVSAEYKRLMVDSNGYRTKRGDTLKLLAMREAGKVMRSGRSVKLEPMNASDRRFIHTALADHAKVTTVSNGKDPYRYVTIMLKDAADKRKQKSEDRKQKQAKPEFTNIEVSDLRDNND